MLISRIYPPPNFGGLKFEPVEVKRRSRPLGAQRLGKRGRLSKVSTFRKIDDSPSPVSSECGGLPLTERLGAPDHFQAVVQDRKSVV